LAVDASPGVAAGVRTYVELESTVFRASGIDSVAMRYGFFYGPGTWYTKADDMGEQVRQQQVPIIGAGQGMWSSVHIEDAASITVAALECAPGAYNIVDDNPSQQREWLPVFASFCGAPEPLQITEQEALASSSAQVRAVIGPTPGTVLKRLTRSVSNGSRCNDRSSALSTWIERSMCSRQSFSGGRILSSIPPLVDRSRLK
jgi:nucleoside-diphosphate-sugar epimerase